MKCQCCNVEPVVRQGSPRRDGERAMWVQIFACVNPDCANYGKDIGERRVNIFDEADEEEEIYASE